MKVNYYSIFFCIFARVECSASNQLSLEASTPLYDRLLDINMDRSKLLAQKVVEKVNLARQKQRLPYVSPMHRHVLKSLCSKSPYFKLTTKDHLFTLLEKIVPRVSTFVKNLETNPTVINYVIGAAITFTFLYTIASTISLLWSYFYRASRHLLKRV
jgi:hypothetical protein